MSLGVPEKQMQQIEMNGRQKTRDEWDGSGTGDREQGTAMRNKQVHRYRGKGEQESQLKEYINHTFLCCMFSDALPFWGL